MSNAAKKAVVPTAKKRAELLRAMTPAGRKIAETFDDKLGKGAKGVILIQYDLGASLSDVIENEAEYGSDFVGQLAEYLNIPGGESTLYNLCNFAKAFERKFVESETLTALSDGTYLELGHWIKLSQLKETGDMRKYLKRVRDEAMSVRELTREIAAANSKLKHSRQGGRKPGIPTSPMAGLQQTFSVAQKFVNWEPVLEKSVCEIIDHMPPELVDDNLLGKLQQTQTELGMMGKALDKAVKHVDRNIERVERVLAAKPKEEQAEKPAKPAKKTKAKAKPKKKPVGKKAAKAGKKKPAKKARKPREIQVVE